MLNLEQGRKGRRKNGGNVWNEHGTNAGNFLYMARSGSAL